MSGRRADALAREHTRDAITTLTEVMNDPFAENRDRIRAAEQILDRGHGKPLAAIIQLPPSKLQAQLLAGMSDDELYEVVHQARLPSMFDNPIDAEFESSPLALATLPQTDPPNQYFTRAAGETDPLLK